MKKMLFILVAVFYSFTCFAQDRVNEKIFTFNECSEQVKNITGWCFNKSEGQWVDNKNFIYAEKKTYLNDKRWSVGANFVQIKTFIHNNETKYVLIIAFNGGHYRYPSIKSDWKSYIEYNVYVLNKCEYEEIISPNEHKIFKLPRITYDDYFDKNTDNKIIRAVLDNTIFTGEISITRYKDVIRFTYYHNVNNYFWTEKRLMETEYFEVDITEWDKLKIQ